MQVLVGDLDRLRAMVTRAGLDAVIALAPENVWYIGGVQIGTMRSTRDRLEPILWPAAGDPTFVVCDLEEDLVRATTWIADIRRYVEYRDSPIGVLVEVIRERGLARGRLGVERGFITAKFWEELRAGLPEATFVECGAQLEEARSVKTAEEMALITHANRVTERALHATFATVSVGDTEKAIADFLNALLLKFGADWIDFNYLNAGARTGMRHLNPGDYRVQAGDLIKVDVGGSWGGYHSDVARTVAAGRASAEQLDTYARLAEIHEATMLACRPGALGRDVFEVARAGFARHGLRFPVPHVGHGIGIVGHEWPHLSLTSEQPLEPGQAIMVETRLLAPGKEGYHIEDLLRVTDGAPEILTTREDSRALWIVG